VTIAPSALHDDTTTRRHDVFFVFLKINIRRCAVVPSCRRDLRRRLVSDAQGLSLD
jgi:hypothetical protein